MKRAILLLALCAGCVARIPPPSTNQIDSVVIGTSADDVKKILGAEPSTWRQYNDGVALWKYSWGTAGGAKEAFGGVVDGNTLHILFRDRKVVAKPWKRGESAALLPPRAPEAQEVFARAMAQPTKFTVEAASNAEAWSRAQAFIAKNATMKIQTATEAVVETYNPIDSGLALRAVRTPLAGGSAEIEVSGAGSLPYGVWDACEAQLIRVFAFYVKTGEPYDALLCK